MTADPTRPPGQRYTFAITPTVFCDFPIDGDQEMSLATQWIVEELLRLQHQGRTPKAIFKNDDIKLIADFGAPQWFSSRPKRRQRPNGGWQLMVDRKLFGVPLKLTKGKTPFYIVDDQGRKHKPN